ncbi:MAG: hypothetical protein GTO18_00535 [Anaerolineales bacterium]|nr:hypothetical protein [Anaerolineales bacterium]
MERNALLYFGGKGADYIKLISSSVPLDKPVIVPEGYGKFSEQNILQFFLMPRGIPRCPCDDFLVSNEISDECKTCLLELDYSIPAIGAFPPDDLLSTEKKLITFDPNWYRGIYVSPSLPGNVDELFIEMDTSLLIAFVLDIFSVVLIFLLGASIVQVIDQSIEWIDLLSLGIPIGGGIISWVIFVLSWIGIPISLPLYFLTWLGIFVLVVIIRKTLLKKDGLISLPDLNFRGVGDWLRNNPHLLAIILVVAYLSLSSFVISIGRGYSLFDGIANWALKAYGIAYEGTVFAGQKWGGHSLEYPQNIHILIALFRLLDGDVLPGSKFLPPLFMISLLSGCYSLWRRVGIMTEHAVLSVIVLISIPTLFIHSTLGWGNLIFSTYLVLAVCYLVIGIRLGQSRKLVIGGILLALAAWTRPEGIGYAIALILLFCGAFLFQKKAKFSDFYWTFPVVLVSISWLAFSVTSLSRGEIGQVLSAFFRSLLSGNVQFDSLSYVIKYSYEQYISIDTWGIVYFLIVLFLGLSFFKVSIWRNYSVVLTLLSGMIALAIPVFMFYAASFMKGDMGTFLRDSFDRAQFPSVVLLFSSAFMALAIPDGH